MSNLISAQALHLSLEDPDLRTIDARFDLGSPVAGRQAYEQGHLPRAAFLDLDEDLSNPPQTHGGRHPLPDMQIFADKLAKLGVSNSSKVVVYDDSAGVFAGRVWFMLRYAGHDVVQVLDGGLSAWLDAGYALTEERVPLEPGLFTLNLRPQMLADMVYVRDHIEDPSTLLVDARAGERYRGEVEPLDKKAGHIPGALNRPYSQNLSGKTFKNAETLQAELADIAEADEVILYCGSGVSAAHNLLALEEAGVKGARLYVGSWSDWSSYEENPVEVD